MSSGPHQYKQREASRAIRAAKAAGIKNPEIEIDLGGGRRMIIRDGDRGRPREGGKELDEWIDKHAREAQGN
jgi:hypothetical protein